MVNDLAVNTATSQAVPACPTCCGFSAYYFFPSSVQLFIDGFEDVTVEAQNACTGQVSNIDTDMTDWFSSDASIAAVTPEDVQGASIGTATAFAEGTVEVWGGVCGCHWEPIEPSAPVKVTPAVAFVGGNNFIFEGTDPTVTVFNGQQVQGNPTGGTFAWSASTTSSYKPQVLFNNSPSTYSTAAGTVTLSVSGALSSTLLDTTLSVGYTDNSISSPTPASKAITIRQFEYLVQNGSIQNIFLNGPSKYGITSTVYYNVYTHPQGQILNPGFGGISVLENVTLGNCNFAATLNTSTGSLSSNSEIVDDLSLTSTAPLPPSVGCTADQYLSVGGFVVRHNTLNWSSSGPTITNLGPTS